MRMGSLGLLSRNEWNLSMVDSQVNSLVINTTPWVNISVQRRAYLERDNEMLLGRQVERDNEMLLGRQVERDNEMLLGREVERRVGIELVVFVDGGFAGEQNSDQQRGGHVWRGTMRCC